MTDYVFTHRDCVCRFVDGSQQDNKSEKTITFCEATLSWSRVREIVEIKHRGSLDHMRLFNEMQARCSLSFKYADADLPAWIQDFQSPQQSTSTAWKEMCDSPNDYDDPFWTNTNLQTPMPLNGADPTGTGTAQTLTPLAPSYNGNIFCSVTFPSYPGEEIFTDFWYKRSDGTAHNMQCQITITKDAGWKIGTLRSISVPVGWRKYTDSIVNESSTSRDETLAFRIYPQMAPSPPQLHTTDLWGVSIRREVFEVPTWDLYIDVYKDGAIERQMVIENVAFENFDLVEDDEATTWDLSLISHANQVYEFLY